MLCWQISYPELTDCYVLPVDACSDKKYLAFRMSLWVNDICIVSLGKVVCRCFNLTKDDQIPCSRSLPSKFLFLFFYCGTFMFIFCGWSTNKYKKTWWKKVRFVSSLAFLCLLKITNQRVLKVPSHQIRWCLKCYGWIGLDEYKDRGWEKVFLMLPPFLYFNLSSPSGIATCAALHAIRRFRRQYCSRGSNSDKYTLLLYNTLY